MFQLRQEIRHLKFKLCKPHLRAFDHPRATRSARAWSKKLCVYEKKCGSKSIQHVASQFTVTKREFTRHVWFNCNVFVHIYCVSKSIDGTKEVMLWIFRAFLPIWICSEYRLIDYGQYPKNVQERIVREYNHTKQVWLRRQCENEFFHKE